MVMISLCDQSIVDDDSMVMISLCDQSIVDDDSMVMISLVASLLLMMILWS